MNAVVLDDVVVRRTRTRSGPAVLERALALAVGIAAGIAVAAYVYAVCRRVGHPFELEWIEGGSLGEVRRVLDGHQLYTAPSIAWTPNIYPPVYFWTGAGVAAVFGASLTTLRAVSIVSSLVLGTVVWRFVREETHENVGPWVAVGLVFASYRIGGTWYDVARVDTMFLALLFAGLLLARCAQRPLTASLAASVLVLAVFTKQSGLIVAVAAVPWMVTRGPRVAAAFIGTLVGGLAVFFAVLQTMSHGWFMYYMWTVPSAHAIEHSAIVGFWTGDIAAKVLPAVALTGVAFAGMRRARAAPSLLWFYAPVASALVCSTYFARLHTGGWDNVLLPLYVGVALFAGVAVGKRTSGASRSLVLAVVLVQFALLAYNPLNYIPRSSDVAAGEQLVAELRGLPGPILVTGQPWLVVEAGRARNAGAHASALQDVLRAGVGSSARNLERDLETAIHDGRFCSVVVDEPFVFSSLPADFAVYYERVRELVPAGRMEPVTGTKIAPRSLWQPRSRCSSDAISVGSAYSVSHLRLADTQRR